MSNLETIFNLRETISDYEKAHIEHLNRQDKSKEKIISLESELSQANDIILSFCGIQLPPYHNKKVTEYLEKYSIGVSDTGGE